jgi:ribosomal protein S18 acetylase RimI-like enzyme
MWAALDGLAARVRPTPWGAVVTDPGAPDVWDLNYARVDAAGSVRVEEIEDELLPALRGAGVTVEHVVSLAPEEHGTLFDTLKARGHGFGWDVLLERLGELGPVSDVAVEEFSMGDELTSAFGDLLREGFEVQPEAAIGQLVAFSRDVLDPAGRRWFGVRDTDGRIVAMGSMILLEGAAYIDDVAALPRSRGRGFASAIVARILDEADAAGAARVYLLADPAAPRVVAMYERLGFREVGRLASTRGPTPDA